MAKRYTFLEIPVSFIADDDANTILQNPNTEIINILRFQKNYFISKMISENCQILKRIYDRL